MSYKPILDACCGSRMFYFDKQNPHVLFADNRTFESTLCDGRLLKIEPDVIHDFTDMPHPDKSFKCVIFDPLHLVKGGFDECMRVLDDSGSLIFKWAETQITAKEILSAIGVTPIIGHKSGRLNNTHWLLFINGVS
ncbi:methyltransferase [Aggregatibacter kilianii]|uniref:methyltransferase n=1 Tax=Aggregatibacter kilianii TaxID=2025884 RepID=UPI000D65473C|nr:methyltransferase [Aggregatibacter kilianii]